MAVRIDFLEFYLFGKADETAMATAPGVPAALPRVLRERGVHVLTGQAIMQAEPGQLRRADGTRYALDGYSGLLCACLLLWLCEMAWALDSQRLHHGRGGPAIGVTSRRVRGR